VVQNLGLSLGGMADGADKAAFSQGTLAHAIEESTRLMVVQGSEAARVAGQVSAAQQRQAKSAREAEGGFKKGFNEALRFAGPGILEATKKAVEEGERSRKKLRGCTRLARSRKRSPGQDQTSGSFPRRTRVCSRRNISLGSATRA
jgi:hypothetical protein